MNAKIQRQAALTDARKGHILAGAEKLLLRVGMEKASMREIAKESGYTPGALYSYFSSRQQLMVALLSSALERLDAAVDLASAGRAVSELPLIYKARAWMEHLLRTPLDRQLLIYFFAGGEGAGEEVVSMLRVQIGRTLLPLVESPPLSNLESHDKATEIDGVLAHALGLLLVSGVNPAGFGDKDAVTNFERYLHRLHQSYAGQDELGAADADTHLAQIDLFN